MSYPKTTVILQEPDESALRPWFDLEPSIIHFRDKCNDDVIVNLSNLTTQTVTIQPRAVRCELQPVSVAEKTMKNNRREEILTSLKIDEENLLDEEQKTKLMTLMRKHEDLFSLGDTDIGLCTLIKHRVDLLDDVPFKQRHRRIPPAMIDEVRQHIEQLLACGVIRPSKSPWTSNVVLVRKKNGKPRMCVDYRMLNQRTVKDSFALPRIDEIFDSLHGAKYFSTLDMKSGYHQVEVEESHKERTAFTVGTLGFYEYNRMPFGLTNAPATYQRLSQQCLGDLNMRICLVYLDDIIIFSNTFEEHLERIDIVFQKLKDCNLK